MPRKKKAVTAVPSNDPPFVPSEELKAKYPKQVFVDEHKQAHDISAFVYSRCKEFGKELYRNSEVITVLDYQSILQEVVMKFGSDVLVSPSMVDSYDVHEARYEPSDKWFERLRNLKAQFERNKKANEAKKIKQKQEELKKLHELAKKHGLTVST